MIAYKAKTETFIPIFKTSNTLYVMIVKHNSSEIIAIVRFKHNAIKNWEKYERGMDLVSQEKYPLMIKKLFEYFSK